MTSLNVLELGKLKSKEILEQRKNRKDAIQKKRRRTKFQVMVRYVSTRRFTIMADNEREAILKAIKNLYALEPVSTSMISALVRSKRGGHVYDYHFDSDELENLDDY